LTSERVKACSIIVPVWTRVLVGRCTVCWNAKQAIRTKIYKHNLVKEALLSGSEFDGEFDPGSGQTLAACLRHASRTGDFGP
jgi:hypothetical protein